MLLPSALLLFTFLAGFAVSHDSHGGNDCTSPTCSSLPAHFFPDEGSKRVAIQYGPYTTPARSTMNGMKDFEAQPVQMPCTDCLITWMQADLHYENGTEANANTGLWLHHTLLVNAAEQSLTCPDQNERFFASGNERTAIDICVHGTDEAGYYISHDAEFGMLTELMNMSDEPASAVVTITYEYIPSPKSSFSRVKPLWLDIGGCETSELPAFANKSFQHSSKDWTAQTEGHVTFIASHLHDGGTHLETKSNHNIVCNSVAAYGQTPAYVDTMPMNMTMNNGMQMEMNMSVEHLSSLTPCTNQGTMKAGDKWSVTAYYDTDKYAPMTDMDGSLEPIMGIAIVYFAEGKAVNMVNNSAVGAESNAGSALSIHASAVALVIGLVVLLVQL